MTLPAQYRFKDTTEKARIFRFWQGRKIFTRGVYSLVLDPCKTITDAARAINAQEQRPCPARIFRFWQGREIFTRGVYSFVLDPSKTITDTVRAINAQEQRPCPARIFRFWQGREIFTRGVYSLVLDPSKTITDAARSEKDRRTNIGGVAGLALPYIPRPQGPPQIAQKAAFVAGPGGG